MQSQGTAADDAGAGGLQHAAGLDGGAAGEGVARIREAQHFRTRGDVVDVAGDNERALASDGAGDAHGAVGAVERGVGETDGKDTSETHGSSKHAVATDAGETASARAHGQRVARRADACIVQPQRGVVAERGDVRAATERSGAGGEHGTGVDVEATVEGVRAGELQHACAEFGEAAERGVEALNLRTDGQAGEEGRGGDGFDGDAVRGLIVEVERAAADDGCDGHVARRGRDVAGVRQREDACGRDGRRGGATVAVEDNASDRAVADIGQRRWSVERDDVARINLPRVVEHAHAAAVERESACGNRHIAGNGRDEVEPASIHDGAAGVAVVRGENRVRGARAGIRHHECHGTAVVGNDSVDVGLRARAGALDEEQLLLPRAARQRTTHIHAADALSTTENNHAAVHRELVRCVRERHRATATLGAGVQRVDGLATARNCAAAALEAHVARRIGTEEVVAAGLEIRRHTRRAERCETKPRRVADEVKAVRLRTHVSTGHDTIDGREIGRQRCRDHDASRVADLPDVRVAAGAIVHIQHCAEASRETAQRERGALHHLARCRPASHRGERVQSTDKRHVAQSLRGVRCAASEQ